jgi:hypothetical protein
MLQLEFKIRVSMPYSLRIHMEFKTGVAAGNFTVYVADGDSKVDVFRPEVFYNT